MSAKRVYRPKAKTQKYLIRATAGRQIHTVVTKSKAGLTNLVLYEFLAACGPETRVLSIEKLRR